MFANDTTILPIDASHTGISYLGKNQVPCENLALGVNASATSTYHLISQATKFTKEPVDFNYLPEYATDENNGTLWKAASAKLPQSLTIDLGKVVDVKRIATQFEYATFFYQYKLEGSTDSINWKLFADRTGNRTAGSPMIDDNNLKARYIRLTITGTEKTGLYAAVWNIRVYDEWFEVPPYHNQKVNDEIGVQSTASKLVDLNVADFAQDQTVNNTPNKGSLGGTFSSKGTPEIKQIDSVKAIWFDGKSYLRLSEKAPASLAWNGAYTASAWVYNPTVENGECLLVWTSRRNMLMGSYTAMMYGTGPFGAVAHGDGYIDLPYRTVPSAKQWHHIAVTFDGMLENVYVDGVLNTQTPMNLYVNNSTILIGASGEPSENYTGYLANAQLFDKALSEEEIRSLMKATNPVP